VRHQRGPYSQNRRHGFFLLASICWIKPARGANNGVIAMPRVAGGAALVTAAIGLAPPVLPR
jgi:hypothetical protein